MRAERGMRQDLRWRVGALVFGVLLLVGAACAAWTVQQLRASGARAASQDAQAIAASVAQTLAQQLGRAARLGIPLAELPGVPPYLDAVLQRQSLLDSIAVLGTDGSALHSVGTAPPVPGTTGVVRVPIATGAESAGFVVVGAKATASLRGSQGQALWLSLLAVLGLSMTAALAAALGPAARLEAQRRLALAHLSHGRSDALPSSDGGGDGLQAVLDALAQGDEEQRAAHAALQAYASELLAMDFDGHLRAPIERIVRQAGPSGGD